MKLEAAQKKKERILSVWEVHVEIRGKDARKVLCQRILRAKKWKQKICLMRVVSGHYYLKQLENPGDMKMNMVGKRKRQQLDRRQAVRACTHPGLREQDLWEELKSRCVEFSLRIGKFYKKRM